MKTSVIVAVALLFTVVPVPASQPGGPIDWDDVTLVVRGLHAEPFLPPVDPVTCLDEASTDFLRCGRSFPTSRLDAEGNAYALLARVERYEIWRTLAAGDVELVAYLPTSREAPGGRYDVAVFLGFYVEPVDGAIYVRLASACGGPLTCPYEEGVLVFRIAGLESMTDVVREKLDLPPGLGRRSR